MAKEMDYRKLNSQIQVKKEIAATNALINSFGREPRAVLLPNKNINKMALNRVIEVQKEFDCGNYKIAMMSVQAMEKSPKYSGVLEIIKDREIPNHYIEQAVRLQSELDILRQQVDGILSPKQKSVRKKIKGEAVEKGFNLQKHLQKYPYLSTQSQVFQSIAESCISLLKQSKLPETKNMTQTELPLLISDLEP